MLYRDLLLYLQQQNPQMASQLFDYHRRMKQLAPNQPSDVALLKDAEKIRVTMAAVECVKLFQATGLLFLREIDLAKDTLLFGCGNGPLYNPEFIGHGNNKAIVEMYNQLSQAYSDAHRHLDAISVDRGFVQNPAICADITDPNLYNFFIHNGKKFRKIIAESVKPVSVEATVEDFCRYWNNIASILADDGVYCLDTSPNSITYHFVISKHEIQEMISTVLQNPNRSPKQLFDDMLALRQNSFRGDSEVQEMYKSTQRIRQNVIFQEDFISLIDAFLKGDQDSAETLEDGMFLDSKNRLRFDDIDLSSNAIQALCDCLTRNRDSKYVRGVSITYCGLLDDDIVQICVATAQAPAVKTLDISGSYFGEKSFVAILRLIEARRETLAELDISCFSTQFLFNSMIDHYLHFMPLIVEVCAKYKIKLSYGLMDYKGINRCANLPRQVEEVFMYLQVMTNKYKTIARNIAAGSLTLMGRIPAETKDVEMSQSNSNSSKSMRGPS